MKTPQLILFILGWIFLITFLLTEMEIIAGTAIGIFLSYIIIASINKGRY